jgi:hypothetical protein
MQVVSAGFVSRVVQRWRMYDNSVMAKFPYTSIRTVRKWHPLVLLSRPTLRRSTPITTMALRFNLCLDTQGTMSVRLVA